LSHVRPVPSQPRRQRGIAAAHRLGTVEVGPRRGRRVPLLADAARKVSLFGLAAADDLDEHATPRKIFQI
jgi:hypothetical protein